jgi:hypothetical protein
MISNFLSSKESKYAVITKSSYDTNLVAQRLSEAPTSFIFQGVEMVILSLEPSEVENLIELTKDTCDGVEFELTLGTNRITLLLHSQALSLLNT